MKKNKIKNLLKALGETKTSEVFSDFDKEVSNLKASLKEKIEIATIDEVSEKLDKFEKKINFDPLISALDNLKSFLTQKEQELFSNLEVKLKEIETSNEDRTKTLNGEIEEIKQNISILSQKETDLSPLYKSIETAKTKLELSLDSIKSSFEKGINELDKRGVERESGVKKVTDTLLEEIEKLRDETFRRISLIGGGSMNRQIKVEGVDVLTKYTDINLVGAVSAITASNDNTNKRVNITIPGGGSIGSSITGGTARSVLFVGPTGLLAQDNTYLNYNSTTKELTFLGGLTNGTEYIDVGGAGISNGWELIGEETTANYKGSQLVWGIEGNVRKARITYRQGASPTNSITGLWNSLSFGINENILAGEDIRDDTSIPDYIRMQFEHHWAQNDSVRAITSIGSPGTTTTITLDGTISSMTAGQGFKGPNADADGWGLAIYNVATKNSPTATDIAFVAAINNTNNVFAASDTSASASSVVIDLDSTGVNSNNIDLTNAVLAYPVDEWWVSFANTRPIYIKRSMSGNTGTSEGIIQFTLPTDIAVPAGYNYAQNGQGQLLSTISGHSRVSQVIVALQNSSTVGDLGVTPDGAGVGIDFLSRTNHHRYMIAGWSDYRDFAISNTSNIVEFYINPSGNVGIGTGTTVSARLHVLSTTEQLRLAYDGSKYASFTVDSGGILLIDAAQSKTRYDSSNYYSTTVGSTGIVTFDAVGSGASFLYNDNVTYKSNADSAVAAIFQGNSATQTGHLIDFKNSDGTIVGFISGDVAAGSGVASGSAVLNGIGIGNTNELYQRTTNGTDALYINFRGYDGGAGQFRDLFVGTGKNGQIAYFKGSDGSVGIGTSFGATGSAKLNLVGTQTNTVDGIGETVTNGFILQNTTSATSGSGNQKFSPAITLIGQGYGSGAGSQAVQFRADVEPVTGGSAPTGSLKIYSKIGASGENLRFTLSDTGSLTLAGALTVNTAGGNVTWGVYTPTRSAEVNLDSNVTMTEAQYMRVGNTVTVSGAFTADPTTTLTTTSFEITLPIASNIGATEDCAGVAFCGAIAGQGAQITGSVANDTAVITWKAADVTSQSWSYTLTYQVI